MNAIKEYTQYKESGIEWLAKVPSHWVKTCIRGFTKTYSDKNRPELELLSVYRDYGVIRKSSRDDNFNKPGVDLSSYKVVHPNVLVLNKMKTWQGSLGISKYTGIVSPAYITCTIDLQQVNPKYINYLLRSKNYVFEFNRLSYGVRPSQWDMRYQDFKTIPTYLPPPEEQTVIANFLDYKLSKIDRFIRKKKQLIKLLNEQKTAIINQAVTKGLDPNAPMKDSGIEWLGEIPKHWEVRKLKYSVKVNCQKLFDNPASSEVKIALENIESGTGRILDLSPNPFEGIGTIFKKGDVLFGKLRPYLAKVVTPSYEGNCVNELLVLSPNREVWDSDFLKYRLLAADFISIVDNSTYGAKMPRANWSFIGGLKVSSPPLEEQEKIVVYIEQENKTIDKVVAKVEKEISLIEEYRIALIAEAVTGKIDVREYKLSESEFTEFENEQNLELEEIVEEEDLSIAAEDEEEYLPQEQ